MKPGPPAGMGWRQGVSFERRDYGTVEIAGR